MQMTKGLQSVHVKLHKYKKARQEVLDKIKRRAGKQVNFVGNTAEDLEEQMSHPDQGIGSLGHRVKPFTDTLRREKQAMIGSGGEYVLE